MMVAIMNVGLVSCSKDDDSKKGDEKSIVGTWMETRESGTLRPVVYAVIGTKLRRM